jgi:hypothetical protein
MSISVAKSKYDSFCSQLGECSIISKSIFKFFLVLRQRLKIKMQKIWNKELLDVKINIDLGYASVEIDESKIISSGYEIDWMFGQGSENMMCIKR